MDEARVVSDKVIEEILIPMTKTKRPTAINHGEFEKGKVKFEHWSKYLDMQNEGHTSIYEYAKKNPNHVIVLRNSDNGALRAIRRR